MERKVLLMMNTDALVAKAPLVKSGSQWLPPKIWHEGISGEQLEALTGCVRKVYPNPFSGLLKSWKDKIVVFESLTCSVCRVIVSISKKPLDKVNAQDLQGTLAEIAMRELELTFEEFFQKVHGGQDVAMVIRVRKP